MPVPWRPGQRVSRRIRVGLGLPAESGFLYLLGMPLLGCRCPAVTVPGVMAAVRPLWLTVQRPTDFVLVEGSGGHVQMVDGEVSLQNSVSDSKCRQSMLRCRGAMFSTLWVWLRRGQSGVASEAR